MLDLDRARRVLGDPALGWLVDRLRARIRRGDDLTGTITLRDPTDEQRRAVERLLGRRPSRATTLTMRLDELESAFQEAEVATDLRSAVEVLVGPLSTTADLQADERSRRDALVATLGLSTAAGSDWYDRWVEGLVADGSLTRLVRRGADQLAGQAAAVLGRVPADDVPLPVLAERVTGDTKALAGTPLAGLVLRALAVRAGLPTPTSAEARRAVWESAGIVADDLSSQVLVLNVTGHENHVVTDWLRDAAGFGIPFRLTLHQLATDPVTPTGRDLYVCENPAVVRVAAGELAERAAPLVCTEGQPSAACHRLLGAAVRAGVRLHWRGDFDWTGLRTTATAVARYGAVPWRMAAADYLTAVVGADTEPLRGPAAPSPWDPALADAMAEHGLAVMEERLLPVLVEDLRGSRRPVTRRR